MELAERRGARRPELVPEEVRTYLESGGVSANHMEQIAMDMGRLLAVEFPELGDEARTVREGGLVTRMRCGGHVLFDRLGCASWETAARSESDTVRGWGAMAVGAAPDLALAERFDLIRPFADDHHFAVREWAWLSVRPHVATDTLGSLGLLEAWTADVSPRVRRFASEATRPRGVWSVHLPLVKQSPELALGVLQPLRSDESKYVQDSVSNWLNDASKTRPDWVRTLCEKWCAETDNVATARICRRAMRTLGRPV